MEDQGSGLMEELPGPLAREASAPGALRGGAGVVTFSGDKLLGGPQAGLVAGQRSLVEPMRRNPLYRALRVDKMTLAVLDATLTEHEAGRFRETVPVLRMVHAPLGEIRSRAEAFARRLAQAVPDLELSLQDAHSALGGGASPTVGVPSVVVSLSHPDRRPDRLSAALRAGKPPVVVRVADDRLLVDLRTVPEADEAALLDALVAASRH